MFKPLLISMILFCACTTGIEIKPIPIEPLLHDSNSKVWVLDKLIANRRNTAPFLTKDKDVFIFYENGKLVFQPLRSLGHIPGKKGSYDLDENHKYLLMYFEDETWSFKINNLTEDSISLLPLKDSDLKHELLLIPIPEINF